MRGMTGSAKLGIVSLILLFRWILPALIGFVCLAISFFLGFIAALHGSRWWFAVPAANIALTFVILYVGYHAVWFRKTPFSTPSVVELKVCEWISLPRELSRAFPPPNVRRRQDPATPFRGPCSNWFGKRSPLLREVPIPYVLRCLGPVQVVPSPTNGSCTADPERSLVDLDVRRTPDR